MSLTSTIYTMGTALNRAQDNQVPVAVLVEVRWMRGHVAGLQGHGVILDNGTEHCVARIERVSLSRASPDPSTRNDHHRTRADRLARTTTTPIVSSATPSPPTSRTARHIPPSLGRGEGPRAPNTGAPPPSDSPTPQLPVAPRLSGSGAREEA